MGAGGKAQMSAQDVSRQTTKAKLAEVKAKAATFREIVGLLEFGLPICIRWGCRIGAGRYDIFMPMSERLFLFLFDLIADDVV